MRNSLKYIGMFCLLIFVLMSACSTSVDAKDIFRNIKLNEGEADEMAQSVRLRNNNDNKTQQNRSLINQQDTNVDVEYLYDEAYRVVVSEPDKIMQEYQTNDIDALFTGQEYIKVPMIDTDGNYGIATFLKQDDTVEFLGEKYDCLSSDDLIINHLDYIEKSFKQQTDLSDIKAGYIQQYGILLLYAWNGQENYVMPYFENEAVEKAMGKQNITASKVYGSDDFFASMENVLEREENTESGEVSGGLAFKSTKHSIFHKVLIFLGVFVIVFLIIMTVQKWVHKKGILCGIVVLFIIVLSGGWNLYHNGVKKIVFPIMTGDNEYVKRKDINRQIKWINSMEYEEIEYSKSLDPGQKSGGWDNYFDIVFWDGEKESYVYDGEDPEYVLITKRDKTAHLYKIDK